MLVRLGENRCTSQACKATHLSFGLQVLRRGQKGGGGGKERERERERKKRGRAQITLELGLDDLGDFLAEFCSLWVFKAVRKNAGLSQTAALPLGVANVTAR
jgi:hypothetical protein